MTFPFPFVSTIPSATISMTDHAVDTSDASTYTFTTKSIGAVGRQRLILVGTTALNAAANRTITSLTIGGTSAAQQSLQSTSGGGAFVDTALYSLLVDAGTTATVVVNWSAGQVRCGVGIWAAYNIQSATARATASSAANPMSTTLNIPAGGVAVGMAGAFQAAATPTEIWAGLTEDFDETVEPFLSQTGASLAFPMVQTGLTISATPSSFTAGQMVLGAFR